MAHILRNVPESGLYPNYIHPQSGQWGNNDVSVGALGDSFYEYLFKGWVLEGKPADSPLKRAYDDAVAALRPLIRVSAKGNMYIAESKNGTHHHQVCVCVCVGGGGGGGLEGRACN
jgi:mannosyl-oligosaccharide alpha-1,2-mannosidase